MIFAGLNCHCGERHYQGAAYYVSVTDGGPDRAVLAVGPFTEHYEALANVDAVSRLINDRYSPGGRAHWYSYGTVAMRCGYARPGKINEEVLT